MSTVTTEGKGDKARKSTMNTDSVWEAVGFLKAFAEGGNTVLGVKVSVTWKREE